MTKIIYSPPGDDPTQREHEMQGPRLSSCLLRITIVLVIGLAILFGAGLVINSRAQKAPAATATEWQASAYPTYTPYPTYTLPATAAPSVIPSATPRGAWTEIPTYTLTPTLTLTVTLMPTETLLPPGFLATWTPGPWLLTRFAATYETQTPTAYPASATSPSPIRTATKRAG